MTNGAYESAPPSLSSDSLTHLRPEVAELKARVDRFVAEDAIPAEKEYERHMEHRFGARRWTADALPPCLDRLRQKAKAIGIWNLFVPPRLLPRLPRRDLGPSVALTYREYGIVCESLGRSPELAPQACNSAAPDTGNMEVLLEFGTPQQQRDYLVPLLEGSIRSAFLMTEPNVASSDPTNLETRLTKTIDDSDGSVRYILTGRKWWSTGAMDPRCRFALVVAKMDYSHPSLERHSRRQPQQSQRSSSSSSSSNPKHGAHTIVLVPVPHPQIKVVRALTVFGYDDAPFGHAEVLLDNVALSPDSLILGEGSGFRVSQARLGPGRIHHCMRAIGMAQRSYEMMLHRCMERETFGKLLWQHGGTQEMIADSVEDLNAARLLTLDCAADMDRVGPKLARAKIATIKVAVPKLTFRVVDRAVQVFGGAGVSSDFVLAKFLAMLRTLRIADGPDAVHQRSVARMEVANYKKKKKNKNSSNGNSRL